ALRAEGRQAGDVGRLEVRRALAARRRRLLERLRDRARENRLRCPRHVLEQDMPAADERREDELDLVRLAVDDLLDVREQPLGCGEGAVHTLSVVVLAAETSRPLLMSQP